MAYRKAYFPSSGVIVFLHVICFFYLFCSCQVESIDFSSFDFERDSKNRLCAQDCISTCLFNMCVYSLTQIWNLFLFESTLSYFRLVLEYGIITREKNANQTETYTSIPTIFVNESVDELTEQKNDRRISLHPYCLLRHVQQYKTQLLAPYMLYERQRIPKGQYKMDNPVNMATLGTQDIGRSK